MNFELTKSPPMVASNLIPLGNSIERLGVDGLIDLPAFLEIYLIKSSSS